MSSTTQQQLSAELSAFTGSESIYRHPLFGLLYSEGVQHLAERAGAYWLIDAVFSHQLDPKVKAEEFQVWSLTVADNKGTLVCTDGNDLTPVARQDIEFTDFPLAKINLWFANRTLYLPSEH